MNSSSSTQLSNGNTTPNATDVFLEQTVWTRDTFSPALRSVISEVVPPTDNIDGPSFSTAEFINAKFPKVKDLEGLEDAIARIQSRIQKTDEDILKEVRTQARSRNKGKEDLNDVKQSVKALLSKVQDIKMKANESEKMVTLITHDIKSLDYAKRHLTASKDVIKDLRMLMTTLNQLKELVPLRIYNEIGNSIEEINHLRRKFEKYRHIPKIATLNDQAEQITKELTQQIYDEFSRSEEQDGPAAVGLKGVCFTIDSLGAAAKQSFEAWFVESQLKDYKLAFQPGQAVFPGKSSDDTTLLPLPMEMAVAKVH